AHTVLKDAGVLPHSKKPSGFLRQADERYRFPIEGYHCGRHAFILGQQNRVVLRPTKGPHRGAGLWRVPVGVERYELLDRALIVFANQPPNSLESVTARDFWPKRPAHRVHGRFRQGAADLPKIKPEPEHDGDFSRSERLERGGVDAPFAIKKTAAEQCASQ